MRKTWPNFCSYRRFSAASSDSVGAEACMAPSCSRSELAGASPPRSPMRGWAFIASSHSSSVRASMAWSAASNPRAATSRAHRLFARHLYSRASRSSLNPQRHQLETAHIDEPSICDLQLGDHREGEEAQGHEGGGHGHAHGVQAPLHRAQALVDLGQRAVAHQSGDGQRELLDGPPACGDDDAAAYLREARDAGGYIGVVDAEDDDVVRVVRHRRRERASLQADVGGEAEADAAA